MRVCIGGPRARARYAKYFNAVDRNDRDSTDYSASIRTNCYYIRIFCWVLDCVVHVVFAVVLYYCQLGVCPKDWKRYQSKNNGRHDLQIDLGIAILNHAIALDWDGDKHSDYIRTGDFCPCDCKKCYFCINSHTTGIAHAGKKRAAEKVVYKCGTQAKTNKCSTVRVNLGKGSAYCKMCYRKVGDKGTAPKRKKKCNSSYLGCIICKETICVSCWKSGYDLHNKY